MKKVFLILLLVCFMPCSSWAGDDYTVEIIKTEKSRWFFKGVIAYAHDQGTRVVGKVSSPRSASLSGGHVDIVAYSSAGEEIGKASAEVSALTDTLRRQGGVPFKADFEKRLPPGAILKISFHKVIVEPEPAQPLH